MATLKWRMNPVTPISFLDHIVRRLGLKTHLLGDFFKKCEDLILSLVSGKLYSIKVKSLFHFDQKVKIRIRSIRNIIWYGLSFDLSCFFCWFSFNSRFKIRGLSTIGAGYSYNASCHRSSWLFQFCWLSESASWCTQNHKGLSPVLYSTIIGLLVCKSSRSRASTTLYAHGTTFNDSLLDHTFDHGNTT